MRLANTLQIWVSLGGLNLTALLDSGSSHNFIAESAALRTGLAIQRHSSLTATVANDEHVPCPGVIRQATFTVKDDHFSADLYLMPLAGYDVVLGAQWLATLGPMLWDFNAGTVSSWQGRRICWTGTKGPATPAINAATASESLLAELASGPSPAVRSGARHHAATRCPAGGRPALQVHGLPQRRIGAPVCLDGAGSHPPQHVRVLVSDVTGQEGGRDVVFLRRLPRPQRDHRQGRFLDPGGRRTPR